MCEDLIFNLSKSKSLSSSICLIYDMVFGVPSRICLWGWVLSLLCPNENINLGTLRFFLKNSQFIVYQSSIFTGFPCGVLLNAFSHFFLKMEIDFLFPNFLLIINSSKAFNQQI